MPEGGEKFNFLAEVRERDRQDSGRADSPLKQADDAVFLDTTTLTLDAVVARIHALYEARTAERAE